MTERANATLQGFAALALYLALAAFLFARPSAPQFASSYLGWGVDQCFFIWCLTWWPYAFAHHLNPFVAKLVFAPSGLNLTWTTPVPLMSWVALPLTSTLGPVAAYNLLCVICPALGAWSAFLLCRYLTRDFWSAVMGGYLFGFSAYVLGHILGGHLDCFAVFLVPLIIYLVLAQIEGRIERRTFALFFFALLVAQFLIATEVVATTTILGAAALAVAWMSGQSDLRRRIQAVAAPISLAYLATAVAVSPWLYYMSVDFRHKPLRSSNEHSADLLSLVIPTQTIELGDMSDVFRNLSSRFTSNIFENGSYVGVPLLIIAVWFAVARWRTVAGKVLTLMLAITIVMGMGPWLHVAGIETIVLPWRLMKYLPLLNQALPIRISLYTSLILAIMAAIWFSTERLVPLARLVVAALVLASLMPNPSAHFWGRELKSMVAPPFFSHGLYRHYLVKGETVMVPPYNWGAGSDGMLWQAETGMYFRLATGYLPFAPEGFYDWPIVTSSLQSVALADVADQWMAFVGAHEVNAVVLADGPQSLPLKQMLAALKVSPLKVGGVLLYQVRPETLAPYANLTSVDMEARENDMRFSELLIAAHKYLADGGDPAHLNLGAVVQRGLLAGEWLAPHIQKTSYTVWLNTEQGGRIDVGLTGHYEALRPLIERYGFLAQQVYFPHHRRRGCLPRRGLLDHRLRRLVMVFDRNGISRAAFLAMTARRGSGSDGTFSKDRANVIRSAPPTLDARLPVAGAGGP
jgi:hypothetical protein